MLASHSVIFWIFYAYEPNMKTLPSDSPLPRFYQVCLFFYSKYFINLYLLRSDYFERCRFNPKPNHNSNPALLLTDDQTKASVTFS